MTFDNETFRALFEGTKAINDSPTQTDDPAFKLEVGEGCRIRQDYVGRIPSHLPFKVMWTRVSSHEYRWLDSTGRQGTVNDANEGNDQLQFSEEHWEKT